MKRLFHFSYAITAACLISGQVIFTANAQTFIPQKETKNINISDFFSDSAFKNWLLDQTNLNGIGSDGILTESECLSVTKLDLTRLGISNLDNIHIFPNLEILSLSYNNLSNLDVSKNTKLESLYISNNRLTTLNLSQNSNLVNLNCSFNQLTELDLSGHDKLRTLKCEFNYLTKLDISGCDELISIYCRHNNLNQLDFSENLKLEFIETFDNSLTSIDVSNLSELKFLHIDHNRLTELDLRHNLKLEGGGFVVKNNYIQQIHLPNLQTLLVTTENYDEQQPIDGYNSVKWYIDANFTIPAPEQIYADGQTLYSKRTPNQYKINFSANGGYGSMPTIAAIWDVALTLPENNFQRRGYTFSHWSTLHNADHEIKQDKAQVSNLAGRKTDGDRITLYARWNPNAYTIKLNSNTGQGQDIDISAQYDQTVTLPVNTFTKDDMEFSGWSRTPDGPIQYPDSGTVRNLTDQANQTVTLYAVWRQPLSEIQKPYIQKLEQSFQSLSSGEGASLYTSEDWKRITDIYTQGIAAIQATDLEEQMSAVAEQAIQDMKTISTLEQRVHEVSTGWLNQHAEVLFALNHAALTEENSARQMLLAQEALTQLEIEALGVFCPLTTPDAREQVLSSASAQLQSYVTPLQNFEKAAQWVSDLNGLTLQPMHQVTAVQLERYQDALNNYNHLDPAFNAFISNDIFYELYIRYELAGEKRSTLQTIQVAYEQIDLEKYSSTGQIALQQIVNKGQSLIEQADSVVVVQEAGQRTLEELWKIPTIDQESQNPDHGEHTETPSDDAESIPSDEGASGSGNSSGSAGGDSGGSNGHSGTEGIRPSGGGSNSGGVSGNSTHQSNEESSVDAITITDNETGARAVVTTDNGMVTAKVTMPSHIPHTTLIIPCNANNDTIAVFIRNDNSRMIVTKSVPVEGGLVVQLEQSGRIEIIQNQKKFQDVPIDSWFASDVSFVTSRELFLGTNEQVFSPDQEMTRSMLVTVLHRLEGQPSTSEQASQFSDVPVDAWHADAVAWAIEQGITNGSGDGRFQPNASITREELVQMLYRLANVMELSIQKRESLQIFQDADVIASWAQEAMEWAYANKIIYGNEQNKLLPQVTVNRAEVAAILNRFIQLAILNAV